MARLKLCSIILLYASNGIITILTLAVIVLGFRIYIRAKMIITVEIYISEIAYLLGIMVGFNIITVTLLGWYAAYKRKNFSLILYAIWLLTVCVLAFTATLTIFAMFSHISRKSTPIFEKGLQKLYGNYSTDEDVQLVIDNMQTLYQCCGPDKPIKYNGTYPSSCCKTLSNGTCLQPYKISCAVRIMEYTKKDVRIVLAIILCISFIGLVAGISAIILFKFMALSGSPLVVNSEDICPTDSEAIDGICKCNVDLCEAPPCDMFLHLVRNGTDTPGNCCPLYSCDNCTIDTTENGTCACGAEAFLNDRGVCECIDQHKSLIDDICTCDPNKCELPLFCDKHSVPVNVKEGCCVVTHCITCPEDSYPTDFQSPELEDKCVCFPCPETKCNDTHVPQILRKGQNVPQHCCDLYKCIPKETPEQECVVNDIIYTNGEGWINQDEQNCTCINGIPLCNEHYATDVFVKHCLINNTAYPHLTTWQEDICTNCTCYDGLQKCITHLCNITESKVKKYEDCLHNGRTYNHSMNWLADDSCTNCTCNNGVPNCDGQACNSSAMDTTNNNNCPPLDNCKKFCRNGFKLNKRGCETCKCKLPERTIEKYPLLETYMKNHNLSEAGVLELLHEKPTQTENQRDVHSTSAPPDQSKDCEFMSYIFAIPALCVGILLGYFIHFCWKRKNSCDYRPVSKAMDNNNLPTHGNIKYISEKSPLKT